MIVKEMLEEHRKKAVEYVKKSEESLAMKQDIEQKENNDFKKADKEAKKAKKLLRNAKAESTNKKGKKKASGLLKRSMKRRRKNLELKMMLNILVLKVTWMKIYRLFLKILL